MEIWLIVLRVVRGVVRRRKALLGICTVAALALAVPAAYYVSKEPPRFKTTAVVLLESKPDRVPLFQEFSPFRPLGVQLAILRSRSLAETVIETLPKSAVQDLIENPYYVDWMQTARNAYLRYTGREPEVESPQRRALTELYQARVTFDLKTDGIVGISAEASKPQVAVDIANTYIEALMARTRSFNIDDARVTREFLEQQLADVKKNLGTSEGNLRSFMASHGGVKIPDRSQATVSQLTQAESALAEVEASRKMLQTRLEGLRQKVETQKQRQANAPAPAELRAPSPEVQQLRGQLVKLESTLLELRNRYTDEHPRVRLVKDRIAEIQNQLGGAIKEAGPIVPAPGAVPVAERVNFAEQLVALEASFHSISAQEEAMRKQVESLRANLKGLSASEQEYTRLTRDTESNRTLHAMLSDKLAASRIREQGEMKVVKIIDPPPLALPTVNHRRIKFLLAGLMLGLLGGAAVPAGVEWLHKRVETEDDVTLATGLPVLCLIPHLRSGRPRFIGDYPTSGRRPSEQMIFTEALRGLRVSMQLAMKAEGIRTVLVTSPFAHEGKSMLVLNLALSLAEVGTRVLIADSDLQRPVLHRATKAERNGGGLVKVLHAEQPLEAAMTPVSDNVWLVPRGDSVRPQTRGMFATGRMRELIQEMTDRADLVICDSSPALLVPDNLFLAGAVDAVVMVAKAGSTSVRDLARTKDLLEGAGAKFLGVVINEMPPTALRGHYKQYYDSYIRKDTK